jgi:hypothetical protein
LLAGLLAVLAGALAPGCKKNPAPPSIPSGCWTHAAARDGSACATATDVEPNDTTSEATDLGSIACSGGQIQGLIADDVDVFHVTGARCPDSQPSLSVTTDDPGVRTCLFVSCQTGKAGIAGCSPAGETQAEHLPEGMIGCCRLGPGDVVADANCDTDFARAAGVPIGRQAGWYGWVVVDRYASSAAATVCGGYTIQAHF